MLGLTTIVISKTIMVFGDLNAMLCGFVGSTSAKNLRRGDPLGFYNLLTSGKVFHYIHSLLSFSLIRE